MLRPPPDFASESSTAVLSQMLSPRGRSVTTPNTLDTTTRPAPCPNGVCVEIRLTAGLPLTTS